MEKSSEDWWGGVRPSNSQLWVTKVGGNSLAQFIKMERSPGYYLPASRHTPSGGLVTDGYCMPIAQPVHAWSGVECASLMQLMKQYHGEGAQEMPLLWASFSRYHEYVRRLTHGVPNEMASLLEDVHWGLELDKFTKVNNVHGDLTMDNVVTWQGAMVFIDPSVTQVPLVAEVDVAKVLTSQCGFGDANIKLHHVSFLDGYYLPGVKYMLVTHLIRMYAIQPPKVQEWCRDMTNLIKGGLFE